MFLPLPLCKSAHCDLRSVIIFKTLNLSSSERVRGYKDGTVARAHVPQTSPRMAWTGASKTKVLVRPGCLHSWVVFLDSMGGERGQKCQPLSSSIMRLKEALGKQMALI